MIDKKPFVIGLTGSIGMGKSTTAQMFADLGVPVWDADQAVARLYAKGGGAVDAMYSVCPGAVKNGAVDKALLRDWIANDDSALTTIEATVHPLVAADRAMFLSETKSDIVVLDIPLLFETGGDTAMDIVVVVSAPSEIQHDRVMKRPDMTEKRLNLILDRQLGDAKKRERADVVIETLNLDDTRKSVQKLVSDIKGKLKNA